MENNNPLLWTMALTALASTNAMAQVDVTSKITNPTLNGSGANSAAGWTVSGFNNNVDNVIESYCANFANKDFNLTQKVTLSAGTYRLVGYAFYRHGNVWNKDAAKSCATMFAGSNSVAVRTLASEAYATYPNVTGTAADAFKEKKFRNEVVFTLDKEQEIELGFKGTHEDGESWFIAGSVELECFGADATSAIANASFESGISGWVNNGFQHQSNNSFPEKEGTYYCEKWVPEGNNLPNADIHQDLKNLPAGKYLLSARGKFGGEGFYLYAGDKKAAMNSGYTYSVISDIEVKDGKLTIGAKLENAKSNYARFDGIRLTISQESLDAAIAELTQKLSIVINKTTGVEDDNIKAVLLEVSGMQVKINSINFADYKAYKNSEAGNLAEQIEALGKKVDNLVANKKQYDAAITSYKTLEDEKAALDAAYENSDKANKTAYETAVANYEAFKTNVDEAYKNLTAGTVFTDAVITERIAGLLKTLDDTKTAIETGNTNMADYAEVGAAVENALVAYTTASSALYNKLSGQWQDVYGDWYAEAIVELNNVKKDIEAVKAANEAGKSAEGENSSTALKDANKAALATAVADLQGVVDKWIPKADTQKEYYTAACADVKTLTTSLEALFDENAPKNDFDVTAIESAIEALQANVDAANKAHTIKGEAPFCDKYNEDKAAIEKQISDLGKEVENYKAYNFSVKTIGDLQYYFKLAMNNPNDKENPGVYDLVSEDGAYKVNGKYTATEEAIQKEITAFSDAAKKAFEEGKAVEFKNTLNVSATSDKVKEYLANAKAALAKYNEVSAAVKGYETALEELKVVVAPDPTVTVGGAVDGTETYAQCVTAVETEITKIKTDLSIALGKEDTEHYNALVNFTMSTTAIDRIAALKDSYAADAQKWNDAQQAAAKDKMLAEATSRLAEFEKGLPGTYTAEIYGLGEAGLNKTLAEIQGLIKKAKDGVTAAEALGASEAIAMLHTTMLNIETINAKIDALKLDAEKVKTEYDAEVKAYNVKLEKIANIEAHLNGKAKTETEAEIKSVLDLNDDPNKEAGFQKEVDETQALINKLKVDVDDSFAKETVREDNNDKQKTEKNDKGEDVVVKDKDGNPVIDPGYDSRAEEILSDVYKLRDKAVAATDNWNDWEELVKLVGKGEGCLDIEGAIATAQTEVAKVATNEGRTHYEGLIKGYDNELTKLKSDIETAYNEDKAVEQKETLTNRAKNLKDRVTAVKGDAEANEKTHDDLVDKHTKYEDSWKSAYKAVTTSAEIPADVLKVYMTKFSEIKKQLDDLKTAIDTSWGAGTAVKDKTDQESKLDAANTAIKALEGTWESDYNAEVAKYNEATYNDFNTKYTALKDTYSKAVSLITKISQTSYAADFVKDLQEVTGENGIYSYAEKIRTLKSEADTKYTATEVGKIFDENKEYAKTASDYKTTIETLLASYTDKVNAFAISKYETAYKKAEGAYYNAVDDIANFDKSIKETALADVKTILDGAQEVKENDDFAVKLDGILLQFNLVDTKLAADKETAAKKQYELTIKYVDELYAAESDSIAKFHNAEGKVGTHTEDYNKLYQDHVTEAKKAYVTIEDGKFFEGVTTTVHDKLAGYMSTISDLVVGKDDKDKDIIEKHTAIYISAYNEDVAYHANDVAYTDMLAAAGDVQDELDALKEYVATLVIAHNSDVNGFIEGTLQLNIDNQKATIENSHKNGTSVTDKETINNALKTISSAIATYYGDVVEKEHDAIVTSIATLMHDYDLATAADLENAEIDGYKIIIDEYAAANDSLKSLYVDGTPRVDKDGKPVVDKDGKPVIDYATKEDTHKNYVALETLIGKTRAELAAIYDAALVEKTMTELNNAIAEVEADYDEVVKLLEDCHTPIVDKYSGTVAEMKAAIDAEKAHIAEDAETILLYADNHKTDIAAIAAKYAGLDIKIGNDEIPYDENDAAYARLTEEINTLQTALDKVFTESADYQYKQTYEYQNADGDWIYTTWREYQYGAINNLIAADKKTVDDLNATGTGLKETTELQYKNYVSDETIDLEKKLANYNAVRLIKSVESTLQEARDIFISSRYSNNDWYTLDEAYWTNYYSLQNLTIYEDDVFSNGEVWYDIDGNPIMVENAEGELVHGTEKVEYMTAYAAVVAKCAEIATTVKQYATDVETKCFELGDIDHSGRVDVVDYTYVRNIALCIAEVDPESPEYFAANVNSDEEINIGDVTMIANKIMTGDFYGTISTEARLRSFADVTSVNDALTVVTEGTGSKQRIVISLDNSVAYIGAQMDIKLPAGVTVVGEGLTSRANGHELMSNNIEGMHRVLVSTIDNNEFLNTESALIYLDVEVSADYAGGAVEVVNAVFTDAAARTYKLGGVTTGDATGITELGTGEKVVKKIYSVGGQMLNSLRKGVNIIINSDGTTKKVLKK